MKAKKKAPVLPKGAKINAELDKFSDVVLFPEKLKMANNILKTVGLPNFNQ